VSPLSLKCQPALRLAKMILRYRLPLKQTKTQTILSDFPLLRKIFAVTTVAIAPNKIEWKNWNYQ